MPRKKSEEVLDFEPYCDQTLIKWKGPKAAPDPKLPLSFARCQLQSLREKSPPKKNKYVRKKVPEKKLQRSPRSYYTEILERIKIESRPRKSMQEGWNRLFTKYSPSKEIQVSPIKATECNLKGVDKTLHDTYVDIYTWALGMSEQYFYDNSFLLLSFSKRSESKMKVMLRRSYVGVDMNFFNNLEDVVLLGEGSFGSVYSCRDPNTKMEFAIKYLSSEYSVYTDHATNILDYMNERNAVIRSMDNPFVVKFYYSLQIKKTGALFLFFELCIGDLVHYIDYIKADDTLMISEMISKNSTEVFQNLYETDMELLEAAFIYIFEMMCGLDFLAQSNIVHQDIKPDNMMISSNLHLKIGDFGLAYRTRMIHRQTNKLLINVSEIDKIESTNYEQDAPGTQFYQDFELLLMYLEKEQKADFLKIMNDKETFDVHKIRYHEDVLEPTFLTDTWAMGLTATMLLFRGFEIFNREDAHPSILKGVPRRRVLFTIHLVARKTFYTSYVSNGLINAGGNEHKDLMKFLASIFRPRLTRCDHYTKQKEIYHFKKVVQMRYVDMDKVEQFGTFMDRKFSRSNIHLREVPPVVATILESEKESIYEIFKDFLDKLDKNKVVERRPGTIIDVDPGVNINFFN